MLFFSYSIFISDINSVGKIGYIVSNYSKEYLGYLSYIYLPLLLYPLYKINFSFIDTIISKITAIVILTISIIIFQSLVVTDKLSGKIGDIIVETVSPFIGIAGLWVFVLIGLFISILILFESSSDIINSKFILIKEKVLSFFKLYYPTKDIKKLPPKLKRNIEQKVTIKEVGDTAEILIEDEIKQIEDEIIIVEPQKSLEKDIEELNSLDNTVNSNRLENEKIITQEIFEAKEQVVVKKEEKHSIIVEELEENKKLLDEIEVGEIIKPI
ncbi:MAG: hypothetical protein DRG78_23930, partial [Epsilonproteobacteria bacterium]